MILLAAGFGALAIVAYLALATAVGQRVDERARWAVTMPHSGLSTIVDVLAVVSIGTIAVSMAVFVVTAVVRRRWLVGAAAVLLVAGANITTQALKYSLLNRPDFGIGTQNSLPSGHTTVVTSLGLAALLVVPRIWRPALVAMAAALATFVGAGTLVNGWHRPSDVVAAYAVCAFWAGVTLVTMAGVAPPVTRAERNASGPVGRRYLVWAVTGSASVGAVFVVLGIGYRGLTTNLVLAAVSLAVIGLTSATVTASVAGAADRVLAEQRTRVVASG